MPSASSSANVSCCPHCGARLQAGGPHRCWLCGADVLSACHPTAVPTTHYQPTIAGRLGSFSLASLMLFVTLVAIVCGMISVVPGVGIALALILLPVLAHTIILAHRERELGHVLRPGEKIILFFGSLGLVLVAGVAAAIAFGITCFVGFWPASAAGEAWGGGGYAGLAWGFTIGIGLGSIVAAYVAYRVLVSLSRSKGKEGFSRGSKLILAGAIVLAVIGGLIWLWRFS